MDMSYTVPNTFATQSGNVPASQLDANFTANTSAINNAFLSGTLASLPAPDGIGNGRYYFATDTVTLFRDNGAAWVQIAAAATSSFSTGDVKLTFKTVADIGWVFMNDGTIGDASSGATTRANADTQSLFALFWNNCSNADCPVSGGRGANATADFNAHKTITLPLQLGRALASAGSGAGLTARTLGHALGGENTVAQHTHTINDPGHSHTEQVGSTTPFVNNIVRTTNSASATLISSNMPPTTTDVTNITINNTGVASDGNMQPSLFMNVMVKL
jgi:microcystin-dependent protein